MSMDNYLEHYGILGMKWGVRRSQEELDQAAGRYREKELEKLRTEGQKAYQKGKTSDVSSIGREMDALERMSTEELLEEKRVSRGKTFVNMLFSSSQSPRDYRRSNRLSFELRKEGWN